MRSRLIIGLTALMLTVACGEDPPVFTSAEQMADALGCSGLETSDAELVKEAGTCELEGERASLFAFEDVEQRDRWLNLGERFSRDLITGPTWAVDPPDGQATTVREALL